MHASVANGSTHGTAEQEPGAGRSDGEPTHRRGSEQAGAAVGSEVEAEQARARRPGDEPGEPELAPRRDEQEREAEAAERTGEAGELGQRTGSRTNTAARAVCPLAETVKREAAFLERGAEPQRARGREPAAAAERPAHPLRIRGDADRERRSGGDGDPVAAERDVANGDRDHRRPRRAVAGRVERQQLEPVGARPHRPSVHLPVPDDRLLGAREPGQRAPPPVDEERAAALLVQPVAHPQLVAPAVAVGRDDARCDPDVLDHRRCHVDPDRVRQRDRLVLAAHVDPGPVLALGQDPAGVVAAVPAGSRPAPSDSASRARSSARPRRRRRSRRRAGPPCAA